MEHGGRGFCCWIYTPHARVQTVQSSPRHHPNGTLLPLLQRLSKCTGQYFQLHALLRAFTRTLSALFVCRWWGHILSKCESGTPVPLLEGIPSASHADNGLAGMLKGGGGMARWVHIRPLPLHHPLPTQCQATLCSHPPPPPENGLLAGGRVRVPGAPGKANFESRQSFSFCFTVSLCH